MNDLLERTNAAVSRRDRRRSIIIVCAIVLGSIAWYVAHPAIIHTAARYSLGCHWRHELFAAALRNAGQTVAEPAELIQSFRDPSPGSVVWQLNDRVVLPPYPQPLTTIGLADANFAMRGTWRYRNQANSASDPPADADHDGAYELILSVYDNDTNSGTFGVVRIHEDANEVVGLFTINYASRGRSPGSVELFGMYWDSSGGHTVLAIDSITAISKPPTYIEAGRERLVTFAWSAPGGILIPQQIPERSLLHVWQPPNGQPYRFSPDTPIEDVFDELLPVPDEWRCPPVSAPVPTPATTTTKPPAS